MKRHLNTLYVMTQGSYLSKDGETVLVTVADEKKLRIPIHNIESIVCFGNVLCSPFLLGLCGDRGVHVSFLTKNGRFLARVEGPTSGNVLLRREQYRRADDDCASTLIARNVVIAKLANCRSVLNRALRDHPTPDGRRLVDAERALFRLVGAAQKAMSVDQLRGVEGAGAREYFGCFDLLIVQQRQELPFNGRSRRPPLDPVNALLSFIYTVLAHDVTGALEGVGLDPQVGFLHCDRPGRPSLALDLMDELRPFVADRLALSLINRRQVQKNDFSIKESGAVLLTEEGRKKVLASHQKRRDAVITHPYLGKKTTVGLLPHVQALLLARHLRGDIDGYPAFVAK